MDKNFEIDDSGSLVTVLMPSGAKRERFHLIRRAVNSIRKSSSNPVKIIVVANGSLCDKNVVGWLQLQSDITYVYDQMPSQANAVLIARKMVDTPFFSTLDDDDEYLEGATDIKLNALHEVSDADMIVTNGYYNKNNSDMIMYKNYKEASNDPLMYLFKFNWLHNCNALYKTDRIGIDFFEDPFLNVEWTWLAYKIALAKKKILFLDRTTFRYYDTPMSVSKTVAYMEGHMPLYEKMLQKNPPQDIARLIRARMSMDWHCRSDRALQAGQYGKAITCHLRSLFLPGGLRFLLYSRRLIPFLAKEEASESGRR